MLRLLTPIGIATLLVATAGCASGLPSARVPFEAEPRTGSAWACASAVLDEGCAPSPEVVERATSLSMTNGRRGFYANDSIVEVGARRDALVPRVIDRAIARDACEVDAEATRRHHEQAERLVAVLMRGGDPFDWDDTIGVFDQRFEPGIFPVANSSCDGQKFEGAMKCVVYGPWGGLVDIVIFPIGGWLWAAKHEESWVSLAGVEPSPATVADVRRRLPGAMKIPPGRKLEPPGGVGCVKPRLDRAPAAIAPSSRPASWPPP